MIKDNLENVNFQVVGYWNPKIFHPDWLSRNFSSETFKLKPNDISCLFNFDEREIGYEFGNVKFIPRERLLTISINKDAFGEEKLIFAAKLLLKTLTLLPHTPLKALG